MRYNILWRIYTNRGVISICFPSRSIVWRLGHFDPIRRDRPPPVDVETHRCAYGKYSQDAEDNPDYGSWRHGCKETNTWITRQTEMVTANMMVKARNIYDEYFSYRSSKATTGNDLIISKLYYPDYVNFYYFQVWWSTSPYAKIWMMLGKQLQRSNHMQTDIDTNRP